MTAVASQTRNRTKASRPLATAGAAIAGTGVGYAVQRLFPTTTATGRGLRLAGLTAGITGSYIGYMLQSLFLGEAERDKKRRSTHLRTGRRMRDELLLLRGPAMKFGQALSLHTDIVPAELLAELTKLQMEAPGMHASLARAQFKSSFGRDPEQVFARFEPDPFAAASLGQVHRAELPGGTRVVVKLQYPGIRAAIENDFRWVRQAALPLRASGHLPAAALDEMQRQIEAETDYLREAAQLAFFSDALKPLEYVDIPRAYREYSTDRVLTMTEVRGRHLDVFLAARPSQQVRDLVGARLVELFYFQVLILKRLHADPHWGNYLFRDDGSIGVIDFGCVKELGTDTVRRLSRSFLYAGPLDSPEFRQIMQGQFAQPGKTLPAKTRRAVMAFAEQFYRKVYPPDPKAASEPFDFSDPAFLRDYIRVSGNLVRAKGIASEFIFLSRAEIGLYTTLHRLRARVRMADIVRRLLHASDTR